jgi:hypothetical protein
MGKVTRLLKVRMTPFETGLKETWRAYLRNHKSPPADFAFEDRLIAMARPPVGQQA